MVLFALAPVFPPGRTPPAVAVPRSFSLSKRPWILRSRWRPRGRTGRPDDGVVLTTASAHGWPIGVPSV